MNNFEKIKKMSVKEFAEFFRSGLCDYIQDEHKEFCNNREICGNCVLDWLNQEVKEC